MHRAPTVPRPSPGRRGRCSAGAHPGPVLDAAGGHRGGERWSPVRRCRNNPSGSTPPPMDGGTPALAGALSQDSWEWSAIAACATRYGQAGVPCIVSAHRGERAPSTGPMALLAAVRPPPSASAPATRPGNNTCAHSPIKSRVPHSLWCGDTGSALPTHDSKSRPNSPGPSLQLRAPAHHTRSCVNAGPQSQPRGMPGLKRGAVARAAEGHGKPVRATCTLQVSRPLV